MAITFAVASLDKPLPYLDNPDILLLLGAFPETAGKQINGPTTAWNYDHPDLGIQVMVVRILDEAIHFDDNFPIIVVSPKIGLEDMENPSPELQSIMEDFTPKLQEVLKLFISKMVGLPGFDVSNSEYHALEDGSTIVTLKGDTSTIYNELAEVKRSGWADGNRGAP